MNIEFLNACAEDNGDNENNEDNVRKVRRMISEGMDVNSLGKVGFTGLMVAMAMNNTEVSRILLGCNNIKIDIKEIKDGWTALHIACDNNSIECVKLLLDNYT